MRLPRLATILVAALASTVHAQPSDQNDPYLWLEDDHGEKAISWVNAENAKTLNVLEKDSRYPTLTPTP